MASRTRPSCCEYGRRRMNWLLCLVRFAKADVESAEADIRYRCKVLAGCNPRYPSCMKQRIPTSSIRHQRVCLEDEQWYPKLCGSEPQQMASAWPFHCRESQNCQERRSWPGHAHSKCEYLKSRQRHVLSKAKKEPAAEHMDHGSE